MTGILLAPETEVHDLKISTCDPLKYIMDNPNLLYLFA